ncbi:hypothetical protein SCHPADRAFT_1002837 [Schizopora paradoxa]|uniref:Uncharacterized protein n=1 Tax=Schizopora paradoxa TaxID=27342 RepID=A0A0H2RL80_9AGAM|nr:hypothetical protein SCHPADRAFT_1002837 [Schizopora paradoxa]
MLPASLGLDSFADDGKSSSPSPQRLGHQVFVDSRRERHRPSPLLERHRDMIRDGGKASKLYHGSHRRRSNDRKSLQIRGQHAYIGNDDGALQALFNDNAEDDTRMSIISEGRKVRDDSSRALEHFIIFCHLFE